MEDDCYAARLAATLHRRFGFRAQGLSDDRLARAIERRETVKADLYLAVSFVLRDEGCVFSRSRA